jgi:hypothetical protein
LLAFQFGGVASGSRVCISIKGSLLGSIIILN